MIKLKAKLSVAPQGDAQEKLLLPFEQRHKRRLYTALASGEEVKLTLPRGAALRGGDLLQAPDGRVIEVVAAAERLVEVVCKSTSELARVAYHLGNRHVPLQVGDGFLRFGENDVLEEMVRGLGVTLSIIEAPFEPETGAYGGAHSHEGSSEHRAGRIHEFDDANEPNG